MSTYKILKTTTGQTFNLPVFLEASLDEQGIMVGFDGEIEQIEQLCNFTYRGIDNTITVYNTINTNILKTIVDAEFLINWGDNSSSTLSMVSTTTLPNISHTYNSSGKKTIEITVKSPWDVKKVKKDINIPFINSYGIPTDLGTLTFKVPYSVPEKTVTQNYLENYTTLTGATNSTLISFIGVGQSRIDELKKFGSNQTYNNINITDKYTGYTLDSLYYMDYPEGVTYITGSTISFKDDEIYQGMLTRNEFLIGFIDEPQIYSDIYVERGKQSIIEKTLRLGEINSIGELTAYGNGFFKIKKQ